MYYTFDSVSNYQNVSNLGSSGSTGNGEFSFNSIDSSGACLSGSCLHFLDDGYFFAIGGQASGVGVNVTSTDWSVSVWFKGINSAGTLLVLVTSPEGDIQLSATSSSPSVIDGNFSVVDVTGTTVTDFSTTIPISAVNDNNWHHIACTYSSTSTLYSIYLDGGAYFDQFSISLTDNIYALGGDNLGSSSFFSSYLDEFQFYKRLLSAAEVQNLYSYFARPPVFSCSSYSTIAATNLCSAQVHLNQFSVDSCSTLLTVQQVAGPSNGSSFPVGVSSVVIQASNSVPRTSNCSYTVTVIDTQAPTISTLYFTFN